MTACQKRVNLIGAINLDTHEVQYRQVQWVNGESIEEFLQQLIDANSNAENIHIIWDNAGYHKSEQILAFMKGTKITPYYLPPYSPNLNPIERLWKLMHELSHIIDIIPSLLTSQRPSLDFSIMLVCI